jgi:hypothetical protein
VPSEEINLNSIRYQAVAVAQLADALGAREILTG